MPKKKLQVIFMAAEMAPFVKVGGLADVVGSLPKALVKMSADVKAFLPFYGLIDKRKYKIKLYKKDIALKINTRAHRFDLYKALLPGSKVPVYLIKNRIFDSKQVYIGSKESAKKKIGDVERFSFFSKAVIETIKIMKWQPDIIHAHDWHTSLAPTFIDEYSLADRNFENIKSILTIHNLAHQGVAKFDILDYAGLNYRLTPALMEDYLDKDGKKIDSMKVGILSADYVTTVSPTYAKEILSKEYGEGLEDYLKRREKHLFGILNGIDTKFFNPKTDKNLKKKYDSKNVFSAKAINKQILQKQVKLPVQDVPLLGLVSRLVSQKGIDILIPALEKNLKKYNFQVVILGTGYPKIENDLKKLAKKYPDKVSANISFSLPLAQKIYASSDFFLMPSRFEPCGLGQMIAMRYGTIPIVRATGGLKDTVINNKTGIVFKKYTQKEATQAITKSLRIWQNKAKMKKMIMTDMKQDFSWDRSAKKYLELYKKLK